MRYYARAFPPSGGSTGAWTHVVHLVRSRARLILLPVASKIRGDHLCAGTAGRIDRDAVDDLRGRPLHPQGIRQRRRLRAVRRLLQGTGRAATQLLDRGLRSVRPALPPALVPPYPAQAISKSTGGET